MFIKTTIKDHIATITLNRPDNANAFNDQMISEFTKALIDVDLNEEVRVIIITGEGKYFCAGGDIKKMKNKEEMFSGEPNELRERYKKGIQMIPKVISEISTPIIAKINGAAIGAGLDLACMCDLRVGLEGAKVGETFSSIGLVPGDGGAFFLQRVLGFSKAMEMSLTARLYTLAELSMCTQLAPSVEELSVITNELAKLISSRPPIATQMTKRALVHAYRSDLSSHLELMSCFQGITQRSSDHFQALDNVKSNKPVEYKHK